MMMLNSENGSAAKMVNFGTLEVGAIFYVSKEDAANLIECEKLTNNLVEDENGKTFFMLSSDLVIEKMELVM